jgi:hypothetical protein
MAQIFLEKKLLEKNIDLVKIRGTQFFIMHTKSYQKNGELTALLLKKMAKTGQEERGAGGAAAASENISTLESILVDGEEENGGFFKLSVKNSHQKSRKVIFSTINHDYMYKGDSWRILKSIWKEIILQHFMLESVKIPVRVND